MNTLQLAHATPSYWTAILLAALISAAVSVIGYWQNAQAKRQDRQRQLFADAFRAVMAYREFAFRVRRRPPGTDRTAITDDLSDVQTQLNLHMATLEIEAPRVAEHYRMLVVETRRVAGPQISAGWDQEPTQRDSDIHIRDVDLSGLASFDLAFIRATRSHLGLRLRRSRLDSMPAMISNSHEPSVGSNPSTTTAETDNRGDSSLCQMTDEVGHDEPTSNLTNLRPRWHRLLLAVISITMLTYGCYMIISFSIDFVNNTDEYIAAFLVIAFWVSVASTIRAIFKSAERSFEFLTRLSERLFRSW